MAQTAIRIGGRVDAHKSVIKDDSAIRAEFERRKAWGLASAIDLHGCNAKTVRDPKEIKRFVYELCERIEMKRFGECVVVDFGEDPRVAGYSMTQLIETSLISGHFGGPGNAYAYLDIFSCKYYNPHVVAEFAKEFFQAERYNLTHTIRV